jgi:hypothetical protein
VDVLLVSGGLLDGNGVLEDYRPWLDVRLQQLHVADIVPVLFDPHPDRRLESLDAVVIGDDHVADVAGVCFAPLAMAAERAATHPEMPVVALAYGCVDGVGGGALFDRTLDDRLAASLQQDVAYVALGGMLEAQPLTGNAYFSGTACGVFAFHPGKPGGIVVQIGTKTRRVLDLMRIEFESRRRISITVDGGNMDRDELASVLHDRLAEHCHAVDAHAPLAPDHPLAELYGGPCGANGVGWWSRPIIQVQVFGTPFELADVIRSHGLLEHMLCDGEHLLAVVKWERRGAAKPSEQRFVPERAAAAVS